MELTRVLFNTGDPCPGCGADTAVFLRDLDETNDWVEETRQCSLGCDELAAAIPVSTLVARPRRRRRVA
jgi:hypothetical protein